MNKKILSFVAFAATSFSLLSCSSDFDELVSKEEGSNGVGEVTATMGETTDYVIDDMDNFNLSKVDDVQSRTMVDPNNMCQATWYTGDALSVMDTELSNRKFSLTSGAGTKSGKFKGNVISQNQAYAIYPYNSNYKYNEGQFVVSNVEVKHEYTSTRTDYVSTTDNTFTEPGSNIQVARLANENLTSWSFTQMCACIKVMMPSSVKEAALFSNSGEPIAGKVTIAYNAETRIPYIKTVDDPYSYIKITPGKNTYLTSGVYYYFYVIPGTLSSGFSISIKDKNDAIKYIYTNPNKDGSSDLNLKAGQVIDCGNPFGSSGANGKIIPRTYDVAGMKITATNVKNMWSTDARTVYAWAQTTPYVEGTDKWETYVWHDGEMTKEAYAEFDGHYKKYISKDHPCCAASYAGDTYTEMQTSDDIAYLTYGSKWRIPSREQYQKLIDNCIIEPRKIDGGVYYYFTVISTKKRFVLGPDYYIREVGSDRAIKFKLGYANVAGVGPVPNIANVGAYLCHRFYTYPVRPLGTN